MCYLTSGVGLCRGRRVSLLLVLASLVMVFVSQLFCRCRILPGLRYAPPPPPTSRRKTTLPQSGKHQSSVSQSKFECIQIGSQECYNFPTIPSCGKMNNCINSSLKKPAHLGCHNQRSLKWLSHSKVVDEASTGGNDYPLGMDRSTAENIHSESFAVLSQTLKISLEQIVIK